MGFCATNCRSKISVSRLCFSLPCTLGSLQGLRPGDEEDAVSKQFSFSYTNSLVNLSPAVKLINSVFRTLNYQRTWLSKSSAIVIPSVGSRSYLQFKRFLKNKKQKLKYVWHMRA